MMWGADTKYVTLNHSAQPYRLKMTALILLVMGGLTNAGLFFYHQHLANKTHFLKAEIQQMTQVNKPSGSMQMRARENSNSQNETGAINAAITEITLPWPPLFKALEATNNEAVKLLALEPSPKKANLRITAVALDIDSMMRYMGDLNHQRILKNVTLLSQESAEVNGRIVVRFLIEAGWLL